MKYTLLLFCCLLGFIEAQGQHPDFAGIDFHRADSIAEHYHGESLSNLPMLAYRLAHELNSPVEKFRAIYTWTSMNLKNDYELFRRNSVKRKKFQGDSMALTAWNDEFKVKVFDKLRKEQSTVCTGYAYVLKELASAIDIPCEIINGYGRTPTTHISELETPNHSWNAVQLNGNWYLCDATWSSGTVEFSPQPVFVSDYNDGYFLPEPKMFVKNHYPLDRRWLLMDEPPSLKAFLEGPVVYKQAFKLGLSPVLPELLHLSLSKGSAVVFTLKAPESVEINAINLELMSGSNGNTISPQVIRNSEGLIEITHQFSSRGYYDVHIKMGEDYLVTYSVRVKK